MNKLELCAMTTTYEQVQNIIFDVAHKHQKKFGGDFEEIVASANYHFVRIYKMYEPSKGSFTTWLYRNLSWPLLNEARKELNNPKRNQAIAKHSISNPSRPFVDLFDELSSDAQCIVNLILQTPPDLEELMHTEKGKATSILRRYLRHQGWKPQRVSFLFNEIQTCLG